MRHVEDASSTLTEDVWQEVAPQRSAAPAAPLCPESRVARFFNSLAASMALQRRKPWIPSQHNGIVSPSDILAQHYPQLYIQVMCG